MLDFLLFELSEIGSASLRDVTTLDDAMKRFAAHSQYLFNSLYILSTVLIIPNPIVMLRTTCSNTMQEAP